MKTLLTIIILINSLHCFAQNIVGSHPKADVQGKTSGKSKKDEPDTAKKEKEPRYFYLAANANVFVNTKGGFNKRFSPSIEFGRTYGIFDLGLATGRLNSYKNGGDTSRFIEFRPTINIFSKGRFSEALCLAGGYVFKAKQGLMTEICNSINFNISEIWSVSVLQGYYFFDGTNGARSTQYMGLNITHNFLAKYGKNYRRKKATLLD